MSLTVARILIFSLFLIVNECSEFPSVLILGAGASGIAAATRLLENNITDIRILEVTNRIGGRIHSVEFGDGIVDLGAQWCHGEENNTVYELVKNLSLLETDVMQRNIFYSTGEAIDNSFTEQLNGIFENIYFVEPRDNSSSVGEFFSKRYTETVVELFKNDKRKLELALDAYEIFLSLILSHEGAFSVFDIATNSDFINCEGDLLLAWKKTGYKIILDVLMQKYPNPENALPVTDKIEFNKKVVQITWSHDNFTQAVVKCSDGSEYKADHVIVTFSLGVLKKSYKSLFHPFLPTEKVRAIEELGFASVGKILLHFPNKWWENSNYTDFSFIWDKKDKESLWNTTSSDENRLWLLNMIGLFSVKDNSNVLSVWLTGSLIPEIELLSDEKIIDGIMFVLDKFLGKLIDNITPPDVIMRHKWYSDPNFRGTYSFQTPLARKRAKSGEAILSQPLSSQNGKQALLFAGEATHPHYYSTVHGAIDTGRREADRIIKMYF